MTRSRGSLPGLSEAQDQTPCLASRDGPVCRKVPSLLASLTSDSVIFGYHARLGVIRTFIGGEGPLAFARKGNLPGGGLQRKSDMRAHRPSAIPTHWPIKTIPARRVMQETHVRSHHHQSIQAGSSSNLPSFTFSSRASFSTLKLCPHLSIPSALSCAFASNPCVALAYAAVRGFRSDAPAIACSRYAPVQPSESLLPSTAGSLKTRLVERPKHNVNASQITGHCLQNRHK